VKLKHMTITKVEGFKEEEFKEKLKIYIFKAKLVNVEVLVPSKKILAICNDFLRIK
jgi:peptidase E